MDRGQEKKLSVTQPNPSSNIHQQNIAYAHLKSTKGLPIKSGEYYDNQDGQTTREPNFQSSDPSASVAPPLWRHLWQRYSPTPDYHELLLGLLINIQ